MKTLRNKSKVSTVALVLALTIAATLVTCLPIVNAADVVTYAFLTVVPDPIGVGQALTITAWLNLVPPQAAELTGEYFWPDFEITITKPDETTTTLGPRDSDPVGAQYFSYTPASTGTYTFQFSWPGLMSTYDGNYYKPSTSPEVTITVQQEQIEYWPTAELPTDYWERPIEAQNREWSTIAGNWLGVPTAMSVYGTDYMGLGSYNATGNFNPYTKAPNAPHVVWTKPITFGGVVGGELGSVGYYTGLSYEPKFTPPVIINGILYYNTPDPPRNGFTALDLRTGETLWWRNSTAAAVMTNPEFPNWGSVAITCGQLYDYESPNQHGVMPYLWGFNTAADGSRIYSLYDAITGDWILNLANAAVGQIEMSPTGDMLVYILDGTQNWLAMWNSSRVSGMLGATSGTGIWTWRPRPGATLDWQTGIQWNATVPDVPGVQSIVRISSDVILAMSYLSTVRPYIEVHVAYDAETGEQLWVQNRTLQQDAVTMALFGPISNGVYTYFQKETMQWYGFDVYEGTQLWGPTEPYENAWGMYSQSYLGGGPQSPCCAYGKMYATGYDGRLHCYDLKTGNKMWTFYTGSSGFETPYGQWPLYGSVAIADGKIYALAGEHSPSEPKWRGERMYCIDAETGKEIWSTFGWYTNPAIADGYIVSLNNYDGQIYCFGKGQTATTVTAPDTIIPLGEEVLIKGTVTDQSPGDTCLGIPAAGTPAIADEYMAEWMEYLYMQKPCPMDVNGVPVKLEAFGEDGSYMEIGTVTSDAYGDFVYEWTPPDEGVYTVMATFEGSESYWRSYDATPLSVGAAPEAPAEPEEAPAYTAIDLAIIAAIVVVAILVLYTLWTVRKQRK